ncbi:uroporphyrinogen-III C-methyltransferase [Halorhodospira halophila]|uniref:uroporphyrinogen-III C-methyltransferase n=1 Tax=Halorhodospira halophila TaxID=1053 RepID=UPI00191413C6|nr:uroporphyrinogen-III C-methyltransferase [Halorhodospira halophila]MBK5937380.1 hypothetical protein [Halorhodospira halophila]MBK5943405.1 hypothetical protein [Halorhodospira halophila]
MSNPNRPEDRNRPEDPNRGAQSSSESRSGDSPRRGDARPGQPAPQPGAATGSGSQESAGGGQSDTRPGEQPGEAGSSSDATGQERSSSAAASTQSSQEQASGGDDKEGKEDHKGKEQDSGKSGSGSGGGSDGGGGSRLSSTPEPRSRFTLWFVIVLLGGGTIAAGVYGYQLYEELQAAQQELDERVAAQEERDAELDETLEKAREQAEAAARLEEYLEDFDALAADVEAAKQASDDTADSLASLESRVDDLAARFDELGDAEGVGEAALGDLDARLTERMDEIESRLEERVEELAAAQEGLDEDMERLGARSEQEEEGWLKAEAGYLAQIAIHRVRHHHDVDSALAALRGADGLLAELGGESIPERQAIREAIDALLDYSGPDIGGIRERITARMDEINDLALTGDPGEGVAPDLPELDEAEEGWRGALSRAWSRLREGLGELVRVQHEEELEELLTPEQQYFLREGLRLQLESVLLALHSGDQESYRAGLERAAGWLERRFDTDDERVAEARDDLLDLADEPIRHDLPDIEPLLEPVKPF